MKTLSIAVRSLIAGAAIAAVATACSNTPETPAATTVMAEVADAPAGCRIAYFDADSVMRSYTLARQLTEESQRMMNRYQQQANARQQELQGMAAQIEQKRQNNIYLNEMAFNSDVQNLQRRQEEVERQLGAQQQQIQNAMAAAQLRLNDSITNCVNDLNAVMGFDAILFRESGVYFNPALDITDQIIAALNARYNATTAE